jgi:hypothetical protein
VIANPVRVEGDVRIGHVHHASDANLALSLNRR